MKSAILTVVVLLSVGVHWSATAVAAALAAVFCTVAAACVWIIIEGAFSNAFSALMTPSAQRSLPPRSCPLRGQPAGIDADHRKWPGPEVNRRAPRRAYYFPLWPAL
jgi:hypothetical protein